MPRYRLEVEYDGTPFVGWQWQDNGPSVQGLLEDAGRALTQASAPVAGAGRTDAGVHAIQMTAHIDLEKEFPDDTVRDALNAHIGRAPVTILEARAVTDNFHARFSCERRHYVYRILNRRSPPALDQNRVWQVPGPLDADAMAAAGRHLVGHHDFTTFRSANCQSASPVKTLDSLEVMREGDEILCRLDARSFLHNQVRSIVGTLAQVGLGRWQQGDVASALAAANRSRCGPVAPACGLYFLKADYPDDAI